MYNMDLQKCEVVELSPNWYIYINSKPKGHFLKDGERLEDPMQHGIFCETMSTTNIRNYTMFS